jgi:hypothetical protein
MSSRTILLAAVAASAFAAESWPIPSPETHPHPAAAAAPAASPTTYADAAGFAARSALIIEGLGQEDLKKWRSGYFSKGGDPGKYLPLAAMARLIRDPQDAMARQYLNDERSPKEHYHFAAHNWSRLLPIFGSVLTPETQQVFAQQAAKTTDYLSGKGTENHKTQWYTAGLVLPGYIQGDRFSLKPKAEAAAQQKEWLRRYVKDLYAHGQGEWDSSTYVMFDINGMLNIYDFVEDPECRLMAGAALDWLVAAYALKYTDGIYCGPNQRGHARGPAESIADQTGWLWWGASRPMDATAAAGFRYAMHPLTSSWRPNAILSNIAQRRIANLPSEQRNSKPNYYFGQAVPPVAQAWSESVYVSPSFTLGCLWKGFGGQVTRLQLAVRGSQGALSFAGGSPVGRNDGDGSTQRWKHFDGNGMYDQTAAIGPAAVCLTRLPEGEVVDYAALTLPSGVTPELHQGWWVMRAGDAWVAVHGLGAVGELAIGGSDPEAKKKPAEVPILRFAGRRVGFILQAAEATTYADLPAFAAALAGQPVDQGDFARQQRVSFTALTGQRLAFAWNEAGETPSVCADGLDVATANWPVYAGPIVRLADSVLTISDGRDGYQVDFSGELPIYRPAVKP